MKQMLKKGKQESISEEEIHEFNILIVVMTVHNNKLKDEFSSGSLRQEKKDSNWAYNDIVLMIQTFISLKLVLTMFPL